MSKHQYQALSGQVSGWGLLIVGSVTETQWVTSVCFLLAFLQMILNCYWHYKTMEEFQ